MSSVCHKSGFWEVPLVKISIALKLVGRYMFFHYDDDGICFGANDMTIVHYRNNNLVMLYE